MRSPVVIKCDPVGDPILGLVTVGLALEVDVLVLQAAPQPLDEDVVHPSAAPIHRDLNLGHRECAGEDGAGELAAPGLRWGRLSSVLKISGLPKWAKASSSAAMQNEVSIVFDSRHVNTARLAQSITATR